VQDRHSYNRRLIGSHVWTIKWHKYQWSWVKLKVTFVSMSNKMHRASLCICKAFCITIACALLGGDIIKWQSQKYNQIWFSQTTTILWPFGRDYLGEPVPEETFTHSHLSWSSIIYLLSLSTMIHSVLTVQFMYLTVFLHCTTSSSPLWSTSWSRIIINWDEIWFVGALSLIKVGPGWLMGSPQISRFG